MDFIYSYKRLEKLCGDMFGVQHGISAYIDAMSGLLRGAFLVRGWESDLKQLKHCRWARNQIVHDPDSTEENTCAPDDAEWLNAFYDRIMAQSDPLALYRKATAQVKPPAASHAEKSAEVSAEKPTTPREKSAEASVTVLPGKIRRPELYYRPVPRKAKRRSVKFKLIFALLLAAALAAAFFIVKGIFF